MKTQKVIKIVGCCLAFLFAFTILADEVDETEDPYSQSKAEYNLLTTTDFNKQLTYDDLQRGDIIIFEGDWSSPLSKLISIFSGTKENPGSRMCHGGIVVDPGQRTMIDEDWPFVRCRPIKDKVDDGNRTFWVKRMPKGKYPYDPDNTIRIQRILAYAKMYVSGGDETVAVGGTIGKGKKLGVPYDLPGLVLFGLLLAGNDVMETIEDFVLEHLPKDMSYLKKLIIKAALDAGKQKIIAFFEKIVVDLENQQYKEYGDQKPTVCSQYVYECYWGDNGVYPLEVAEWDLPTYVTANIVLEAKEEKGTTLTKKALEELVKHHLEQGLKKAPTPVAAASFIGQTSSGPQESYNDMLQFLVLLLETPLKALAEIAEQNLVAMPSANAGRGSEDLQLAKALDKFGRLVQGDSADSQGGPGAGLMFLMNLTQSKSGGSEIKQQFVTPSDLLWTTNMEPIGFIPPSVLPKGNVKDTDALDVDVDGLPDINKTDGSLDVKVDQRDDAGALDVQADFEMKEGAKL